jgi:hypothetical protein
MKVLRGDINGPWEYDFYGELWLTFDRAAIELGDALALPPGPAQVRLHKLCASGVIRTIGCDDPGRDEEPKPIPPSQWSDEDIDPPRYDTMVSNIDLYGWLERQPAQSSGGKQSRLAKHLADLFPAGVPPRADCPREPLRAELLKRDPSLKPLDLTTLKTAIDAHNRRVGQLRNTRNASVSD